MNSEAEILEIVDWLEDELEIALRALRDFRLSQDPAKDPAETPACATNPPSTIPEPPRTLENVLRAKIRGNPRPLARARYERGLAGPLLAVKVSAEFERVVEEGRVPWNVALSAANVCADIYETKLAEESLTWARDFTPAYDNHRARMDDEDEPDA